MKKQIYLILALLVTGCAPGDSYYNSVDLAIVTTLELPEQVIEDGDAEVTIQRLLAQLDDDFGLNKSVNPIEYLTGASPRLIIAENAYSFDYKNFDIESLITKLRTEGNLTKLGSSNIKVGDTFDSSIEVMIWFDGAEPESLTLPGTIRITKVRDQPKLVKRDEHISIFEPQEDEYSLEGEVSFLGDSESLGALELNVRLRLSIAEVRKAFDPS